MHVSIEGGGRVHGRGVATACFKKDRRTFVTCSISIGMARVAGGKKLREVTKLSGASRLGLSAAFCFLVTPKVQAAAKCLRALKLMGFKNDEGKVKWVTWIAQFWGFPAFVPFKNQITV